MCTAQPDVPVLVITGFLGAGKSTLVKSILQGDHGFKIAVVENEMASESMGIEGAIVTAGTNQDVLADFIELPNGCLCCNVKDDLVDALSRLVAKRSDLDYIVIETSGLADPGPVAALFWVDEDLEMGLRLDGIVGVVDGSSLSSGRYLTQDCALFEKQIAMSDVILLNKIDCIEISGNMSRQDALQLITKYNSSAPIFCTTRTAGVDFSLSNLFDIDTFGSDKAAQYLLANEKPSHSSTAATGDRPTSITLRYPASKVFDVVLLERGLGELLWSEEKVYGDIWRVKCLLEVQRGQGKSERATMLYQGVGQTFEGISTEHGEGKGSWAVDNGSVALFIGRNLSRSKIEQVLENALCSLPPPLTVASTG